MPSYKYHIFVSFVFVSLAFVILLYYKQILTHDLLIIYMGLPLILFYAILPDIDSDTSIVTRFISLFLSLLVIYCIIFLCIEYDKIYLILLTAAVLLYIAIRLLRHRGFIHSITFALLFSAPIILLNKYLALMCFVAYNAHLLIDGDMKFI